jgi:phosphoglycolate phosphatase
MNNEVRLVIFDWDGTLMDSAQQIVSAMQASIEDLKLETRTDEACKDIIGLGLKEAIERLYPGSDERLLQEIVERYRFHWLNDDRGSEMFPGAAETLYRLKDAGFKLAVATGKGRAGLDKVLGTTGLSSVFDASRCSDETISKPHPKMLLELLEALDIHPRHAIMVGDTEYDIQMAHNASVGPVAVSYGVHEVDRLLSFNPLVCLDRIDQLPDWLLNRQANVNNPDAVITANT